MTDALKELRELLYVESDRALWIDEEGNLTHVATCGNMWCALDDALIKFSDCPPRAIVERKGIRYAIWLVESDDGCEPLNLAESDPERKMLENVRTLAAHDPLFVTYRKGRDDPEYSTPLCSSTRVLMFHPRSRPLDRYWLRQLANIFTGPKGGRVADLIPDESEDTDCVVYGLPVGHAGLLIGPGGVGKTWMLCDIALSVVHGKPALGGLLATGRTGNVAMVCLEETFKQIAGRLSAIGKRRALSCNAVDIFDRDDFVGPNGRDMTKLEKRKKLVEICEKLQFPRLVIVDNAKELIDGSETNDVSVADLMVTMREIARINRCAVVLAHHTNEAATKGGVRELLKATASRGHSNFNSYARWQFHVAPKKTNGLMGAVVKLVKVNHGKEWDRGEALTMQLDATGAPLGFAPPESIKEPQARDMLQDVVAAVATVNPPRSKRETADIIRVPLGVSRAKAEKLIEQALCKQMLRETRGECSKVRTNQPANLTNLTELDPQCPGQVAL